MCNLPAIVALKQKYKVPLMTFSDFSHWLSSSLLGPEYTTPFGAGPFVPSSGPPSKHTVPFGVAFSFLARPVFLKPVPQEFSCQFAQPLNTLCASGRDSGDLWPGF